MKAISHYLSLLFVCYFLLPICTIAQQNDIPKIKINGTQEADFVPKGYRILCRQTGDLNNDGKDDLVLILGNIKEDAQEDNEGDTIITKYNRILAILFKTHIGYALAEQANNLAVCKQCNFSVSDLNKYTLIVKKGTLTLFQHGGSTTQWQLTRKFRYQNGAFYMIGMRDERWSEYMNVTPCDDGPPGAFYSEINLISGERIVKEIDEDCKTKNKHDKVKVKPLIKLANVNLNTYDY